MIKEILDANYYKLKFYNNLSDLFKIIETPCRLFFDCGVPTANSVIHDRSSTNF